MASINTFLIVIVSVIAVYPTKKVLCHSYLGNTVEERLKPPCDVCPQQGQCVPKIRCPEHIHPRSSNPECHLKGTGAIGVCCFSHEHHGSAEKRSRKTSPLSAEHVKLFQNISIVRLEELFAKSENLLQYSKHTVVKPGTPDFGQHLSFASVDDQEASLGRRGFLNLLTARELKERQALDEELLDFANTNVADGSYCPPSPICPDPPSPYRAINGECNNAYNPSWGAANTGFERLLPPDYADGTWSIRSSVSGLELPSARTVSSLLIPDGSYPSDTHNMMFMQFSQLVAHDISAAVMFTFRNGSAISCCSADGRQLPPEQLHFACEPISVDPGDEFYSHFGRTCLNFVRAQLAPSSDCTIGYAKPMNGATHLLDLSQLYGKTAEKLKLMRNQGLLKTFNDYGRELPPLTERKECMTSKDRGACFESGDNHGNQIISLTVFHTILTREHNRVARALSRLNSDWDDDTLFYETRRIVQAVFQHIVYNEWLPLFIGPQLMQEFDLHPSPGYSSSYDPHINPSLLTEFSAAAMRAGHSTVDGRIRVPYPKTGEVYEVISIPEVMFEPARLRLRHFLDRLLGGLAAQPMQSVDPFLTEGLTRYMFHGGNPFGLDLASLNIQRGRDLGVRSYNEYRRLIGLPPFLQFSDFPTSAGQRLSSVYASPEDIDLWLGGLLERPVSGGIVGPTFANIIAEQFLRLKRGDRYYYEHGPDVNPGAFTPSQLAEIKKISLARLICDNKDGIELTSMPPNAFLRADLPHNTPLHCDNTIIPAMDLSRFKVI